MELDSLYQEIILDHYRNPTNKKLNLQYSAEVRHVNPSCGDEITLNLALEGELVSAVTWEGVGCAISQASTSIMTSLMVGKSVTETLEILGEFTALMQSKGALKGDDEVLEDAVALAGVSKFPARIKCALLGWMAFKDALSQSIAKETK